MLELNPALPGTPEEFIANNINLARSIAWKYANKTEGTSLVPDDLHSIAAEGLIKAYKRYDPSFHGREGQPINFGSYATHMIHGEILRSFRDIGHTMRCRRGERHSPVDSTDREIHGETEMIVRDTIPGAPVNYERDAIVRDFFSKLSPRLQQIFKLRQFDLSQTEIARVVGVTQVSISRMEIYMMELATLYGMGEEFEDRYNRKARKKREIA